MHRSIDDGVAGGGGPGAPGPVLEVGSGPWLLAERSRLDASEAVWLDALARFDVSEGWRADGQCSCVDWLCTYAGMARATAYDKVRVARELRHRPVVADALAAGRLSWCAVRAITRATDTLSDTDVALVRVAEEGTVADVELAVRSYDAYASQDRRPHGAATGRRRLRIRPIGDGLCRLEAIVTVAEAAEVEAALDSLITVEDAPASGVIRADSSREDGSSPQGGRVDEVTVPERVSWVERRVDALVELVRGGIGRWSAGGDRYLVHAVVHEQGRATLLGGLPLTAAERNRIACDTAVVEHRHDRGGVPLSVGRRYRRWSVGQRRAVLVRDGGRCRWPGCDRTRVDVHHVTPWSEGGTTDVANAVVLCARHHTLIHEGFVMTGSANGRLEFHRPDLQALGTSTIRS